MYASTFRNAEQINSAMSRVYGNMFLALLVSMVVSFGVSTSPALLAFFFTGIMKWVTIFAPLASMFLLIPFMNANPPRELARLALMGFAALMGLSFATIFVVYTIGSIVSAFMGAAVLFGTLSFYGYFTKKNLESWGSFLFVGLIAIIIASIINIFVGSSVGAMVISALAIIIFLGLTAYDTQRIREMVSVERENGSAEVMGALSLYLNFINIFLSLLQLFGGRKD
jgi:FtsH-binding integral membrane protein